MRYLYVIFLLAWRPWAVRAQAPQAPAPDTAHYEASGDQRRVYSETDSLGICTEVLRWGDAGALVRVFYPSGHLRDYRPYVNLATGYRHGVVTTWHENGQLCTQQTYLANQCTGDFWVYYATGMLKRHTQYVAGNELPGNCFDEAGQPVAYYPFEQQPLYPGGPAQLTKEINKLVQRQYRPTRIAYLPTEVRVRVGFLVATDGSIRNLHLVSSSQLALLDEAVLAAVARLTKQFYPGQRDGQVVPFAYQVAIDFNDKQSTWFIPGRKLPAN